MSPPPIILWVAALAVDGSAVARLGVTLRERLVANTQSTNAVGVENVLFDRESGTISFDIANNRDVPLTAYTYEIRMTRQNGETANHQKTEDFAGMSSIAPATPGNLAVTIPETSLPIPPRGRRSISEDLRGWDADSDAAYPIVSAHASILSALFADNTSSGNSEGVRLVKIERAERAEELGSYVAALRVASCASDRSAVLAAISEDANGRPAVRDWLADVRASIEQMKNGEMCISTSAI
jgi:hypothetical protein